VGADHHLRWLKLPRNEFLLYLPQVASKLCKKECAVRYPHLPTRCLEQGGQPVGVLAVRPTAEAFAVARPLRAVEVDVVGGRLGVAADLLDLEAAAEVAGLLSETEHAPDTVRGDVARFAQSLQPDQSQFNLPVNVNCRSHDEASRSTGCCREPSGTGRGGGKGKESYVPRSTSFAVKDSWL
jgi:hypothetical protein